MVMEIFKTDPKIRMLILTKALEVGCSDAVLSVSKTKTRQVLEVYYVFPGGEWVKRDLIDTEALCHKWSDDFYDHQNQVLLDDEYPVPFEYCNHLPFATGPWMFVDAVRMFSKVGESYHKHVEQWKEPNFNYRLTMVEFKRYMKFLVRYAIMHVCLRDNMCEDHDGYLTVLFMFEDMRGVIRWVNSLENVAHLSSDQKAIMNEFMMLIAEDDKDIDDIENILYKFGVVAVKNV